MTGDASKHTTTGDYSPSFFEKIGPGSTASAEVVVPLLHRLITPASVVDVGCGTGVWISEFARQGVVDYLGIDGDYVAREQLKIPVEHFMSFDLSRPLPLDRRFDLATCLEVAEHLPAKGSAELVATLCRLAPVVAFSAALPWQRGIGHINEQRPIFWRERFAACGYERFDVIRPQIWTDSRVETWYRQNLYLFVARDAILVRERLASVPRADECLTLVANEIYKNLQPGWASPGWYFRQMVRAMWGAIIRRIR